MNTENVRDSRHRFFRVKDIGDCLDPASQRKEKAKQTFLHDVKLTWDSL